MDSGKFIKIQDGVIIRRNSLTGYHKDKYDPKGCHYYVALYNKKPKAYIFIKLYCNFSTGDKRRAKVNAIPSLIRSGMINGITHQARTIARPTAPFA